MPRNSGFSTAPARRAGPAWAKALAADPSAAIASPTHVGTFFVGDPAVSLPPKARAKLESLRDEKTEAYALLTVASDAESEARVELRDAENRRRELIERRAYDDDPAVITAMARIDAARSALARAVARREKRSADFSSIARPVQIAEDFLRDARQPFTLAPDAPAKLAKGETASQALERCRSRLRTLSDEQRRVESAPIPSTMAKAAMRAQIAALAARGKPDVLATVEAGLPIKFSTCAGGAFVSPGANLPPGFSTVETDAVGLLAWLHGPALIAALDVEIDALADDPAALDQETRSKKLTRIAADRLASERDEEAFLTMAAEQGQTIARREDVDPRALLGLA